MDEKLKEYKEYRAYIEERYGRDYQSAIVKLSIKDPYDKRGNLKPQYVLTEQEKNALKYYIHGVGKQSTFNPSLPTTDECIKKIKDTDKKMKELVIQILKTDEPQRTDVDKLHASYELSVACQRYLEAMGIKAIAYEHVNINDVIYILKAYGLLKQKEQEKKPQGRK